MHFGQWARLRKFNPNHDERGRFTFAPEGMRGGSPTPYVLPYNEDELFPLVTTAPEHAGGIGGVKKHIAWREQIFRRVYGKEWDKDSADYLEANRAAIERELRAWTKKAQFRIRAPIEAALDIFTDEESRFKNQHEVGQSQGTLNPDRRRTAENGMFGYEVAVPGADRPIYGYLSVADPNGTTVDESSALAYGGVVFRFKEHVKDSATFLVGDSLNAGRHLATTFDYLPPGDGLPSLVNDPKAMSVPGGKTHLENYLNHPTRDLAEAHYEYIEAQHHGRLTLKDVERITVESGNLTDAERASFREEAAKWGIPVDFVSRSGMRRSRPWTPPRSETPEFVHDPYPPIELTPATPPPPPPPGTRRRRF